MRKEVFIGWCAKDSVERGPFIWSFNSDPSNMQLHIDTSIFEVRGRKNYWGPDEWPPYKVKVTVEWEDA